MNSALVAQAVGFALTGELLNVVETCDDDQGRPAVTSQDLLVWLAGLGWSIDRIAGLADQRKISGDVWPFPLTSQLLQAEPAQVLALVAQLRQQVVATEIRVIANRPLTAGELRLQQEVPPHHGPTG